MVKKFQEFVLVLEGGSAIKTSRRISEFEFPKTLESIKEILFPILDIDPNKTGKQYLVIGSIGKKKDPQETSGDLDIGFNAADLAKENNVSPREVSQVIFDKVSESLPSALGFNPEINYLKGLGIVSIGWPIEGEPSKGIVQLDLIPVSDMRWADFIYYSPDFKNSESKYKSAHRNWLLSAVLSVRKNVLEKDESGEVLDYDKPVLILSDGLYWHKKSYRGKLKPRLKNSQKIAGSERFITRDPQEFVDFALGPGYSPDQVKTFEALYKIIQDPKFELREYLPEIEERFSEYLKRAGLEIPSEIKISS
jgi:hypothetical protein